MNREQVRREIVTKLKEEEEARLNDPEEQTRLLRLEQQEAERMARDCSEFEERERFVSSNFGAQEETGAKGGGATTQTSSRISEWQKSYTYLVSSVILEPRLIVSQIGLICLLAIVQEQQAHPVWGSYAQRLLDPEAALWKNPGIGGHDDKAHPPIHPTKFSAGEPGWNQDQHKVYELVVRHFLACVSQPAVSAETTVEIDIAGDLFSASGRVILSRNYLDVYRYESWGGSVIPTYMIGQQFTPTTLTLDSGVTRPPPLLSEADLLSCMDKAGIGTDATMHDHIKKLLDRFYATKDANTRFSPTNLGEALVMGYDDMGYELWKPYLRSKMEDDMRAVSLGTKRKADILAACLQEMKACFLDARLKKVKLFEAMETFFDRTNRPAVEEQNVILGVVRRCGLCREADMVLKRKPDGKFMVGCLGFPQCRNVVWLPGSISEAVVTSNSCNSCSPGTIFLIQFRFRRSEIPPNYSMDHLGCIGGCDDTLRQLTEICGTGPRNFSGTSVRGRTPSTASGSNPTSNVQHVVCSYCRQTGHSSNDCPSRVSTSGRARSGASHSTNGGSSVTCNSCGEPCELRTANTANNRGRKFYSCQSQECRFFVWEDMIGDGAGGHNPMQANARGSDATSGRRGGRGRGRRGGDRGGGRGHGSGGGRGNGTTFVSATGEPVSGRRCFTCGDPSHFANACPNRGI